MFIGIDIGGTHTRVALGKKGKIEKRLDFPTREFQTSLQEIKEAVEKISAGQTIQRIGIGVPGPMNFKTGKLLGPPHLIGWNGVEVADIFPKLLQTPVVIGHDASVAALGEYHYGAGRNKDPMLYYTVSTGIGVGLIAGGKMYKGLYNPEAGHQILGREGRLCLCKQEADLETYSSGQGLQILTGINPVDLENTKLWEEALEWLAIGIANSILHYCPEIVVIGGGMTRHKNLFFPPLEKFIKKHLHQVPPVPIVPAGLGQESGLIGALTLAEIGD
jgi:glucokinase